MTTQESTQARLGAVLEADPCVNYAMQQNDVPFVQRVQVVNEGDEDLTDVRVTLRLGSELAPAWERTIEHLPAGSTWNLEPVDLALKPELLMRQTERERVPLTVEVHHAGERVAWDEREVEVLAYNEWGGFSSLPEILAAFVMPNHPDLGAVLSRVREHVEKETGDPSLAGYQSRDPERVRALVRGVWRATCDCDLAYVEPPASFEQRGQKVRSPEQVREQRLGTCLDLVLFQAGLLEAVGLHPIVLLQDGHAMLGVWTTEETFAHPSIEDVLPLKKRVQLGEIVVMESTGVSTRPQMTLEEAEQRALAKLEQKAFLFAVDVRAARKASIRPLPLRAGEHSFRPVEGATGDPLAASGTHAAAPARPLSSELAPADAPVTEPPTTDAIPPAEDAVAEDVLNRLDRWKRRLLDLSLRNRQLNHRETKKTLPLLVPDVAALEDRLSGGAYFELLPRPEIMSGNDPRSAEVHQERTGEDPVEAFLRAQVEDRRLHVDLAPAELERRLVDLWRAARLSMEESGANTLYLALGFLHWYETPSAKKPRRAPILLLPLELDRKSVREGYRLRLADEEPMVNVTLLEKLRVDFELDVEGLEQLVEDENGLDVHGILQGFRRLVLDLDRWEVKDEACIGPYSFTKHLMWLDLESRAAVLKENRVVQHLIDRPDEAFDPDIELPREDELDGLPAEESFCPMDADSSQLVAIRAAELGKSFVLEGPPGTGKSQTITNLIAQCLASGKRVLFVSEKMAALNVVRRRLERIGLGPFTLELHSNKARKREVLEQLARAMDAAGAREPEEWTRHAAELEEVRGRLNDYVEHLHRRRAIGASVFEVTARLIELGPEPRLDLDVGPLLDLDAERVAAMHAALDRLSAAAQSFAPIGEHPLRAVRREEWEATLTKRVEEGVAELQSSARQLQAAAAGAGREVEMPGEAGGPSREALTELSELAGLLLATPGTPRELLVEPGWEDVRAALERELAVGRERDALRARLLERYTEALLDAPEVEGWLARARAAKDGVPPLSWFRSWSLRRAVRVHVRGDKPSLDGLTQDLERVLEHRRLTRELKDASSGARLLGAHWKSGEADWDALDDALAWAGQLRALIARRDPAPGARELWLSLATQERDRLAPEAPLGKRLRELLAAWEDFGRKREALAELLDLDLDLLEGPARRERYLGRWIEAADGLRDRRTELRDWGHLRRTVRDAETLNLGPLVERCLLGELQLDDLHPTLDRSLLTPWLAATTDADDVLRRFTGIEQTELVQRFRQLDKAHGEIAQEVVIARLAERVPDLYGRASDSSEVGILQRQLRKSRAHMPIRRLIQRLPNLLPRLKPCFLMSPLSVAQYLDPEHPSFDLVVFDEASQIPVWDAVGAIARGSDVIVVGDSKQLPPTTFFMRMEDEDAPEEDELEELESVLDECVAARLPRLDLRWHYRSRHESLITFSNYHYYDGRLFTFPSAQDEAPDLGVSLRFVEGGVYDRGGSRTNRAEAEAVVAEVVRRIREEPQHSLGVVTFSLAQQVLIEDLLEEARAQAPELEAAFGSDVLEPVFIKNLENVQGDERDVILFSVCYGPDSSGRVSMAFGPLNREGGERRLNVAVTRARRQVLLFSSLRGEAIDLARTQAVGVRHLKRYLEYAEHGPQALAETTSGGASASAFERDVAAALEERGHDVDLLVGRSGYRLDIGVRDEEEPGRYLLGVEGDGAGYRSGATARDRDRTRSSVLRHLGWSLHRVWSSDWWLDRERSLERIERALADARDRRAQERAEAEAAPPVVPGLVHEEEPEPDDAPAPADEDPERPPLFAGLASAVDVEVTYAGQEPYVAHTKKPRGLEGDDLFEAAHEDRLVKWLAQALATEAPIHRELLTYRLADVLGIDRVTKRVHERVAELLERMAPGEAPMSAGEFLWRADQDRGAWASFRVPTGKQDPREPEELPPEEVDAATAAVLEREISLPAEDLVREVARVLGYKRVGKNVHGVVAEGLARLEQTGRCVREEDRVRLA